MNKELERLQQERDTAVIAYNNIILSIVNTIPFKGEIGGSNINIKDQLNKLIDSYYTLQKIQDMVEICTNTNLCNDKCKFWEECDGHYSYIKKLVDEVLG